MLLSETIKIKPKYRRKYWENLGYKIPLDKKQNYANGIKNGIKYFVSKDTEIEVKVSDLPKFTVYKVKVKCDNCKKEYFLSYKNYNQQIDRHKGKLYCCDCVNSICHSKENNNRWNPNLSEDERKARQDVQRHIEGYNEFIKKVLYLYDYSCFLCKSNENLEVHHLDGYEWCKEKRTDEKNGICLCKKCHKNFHSEFGYKKNTKEQFEKWIGFKLKDINKDFNKIIKLESKNKVICLETKKIYNSPYECELLVFKKKKKGLGTAIRSCCNRKGICENFHYVWYNDYLNMSEEEIFAILNKKKFSQPNSRIKVVCLETKQIFSSVTNAIKYLNKKSTSNLVSQIKGKRNTFANCHWCYAKDYKGNIDELEKVGDGW